jgi:hypothetical protein
MINRKKRKNISYCFIEKNLHDENKLLQLFEYYEREKIWRYVLLIINYLSLVFYFEG